MRYTCATVEGLLAMGGVNRRLVTRIKDVLKNNISYGCDLVGSAEYNISLVNWMELTSVKKDLRDKSSYGMGKTSVS